MNWLKQLFTKKHKVTFHMKSGAAITTTCTKVGIQKANGNDLHSYTVEGTPTDFLFYVRIDDVSAITLEN